jgi:hypothetical protein
LEALREDTAKVQSNLRDKIEDLNKQLAEQQDKARKIQRKDSRDKFDRQRAVTLATELQALAVLFNTDPEVDPPLSGRIGQTQRDLQDMVASKPDTTPTVAPTPALPPVCYLEID